MIHNTSQSPIHHSTSSQDAGRPTLGGPTKNLAALGLAVALAAASTFAVVPSAAASCVTAPAGLSAWWPLDTVSFGSTPELIASNSATLVGNPLTNVLGYVDRSIFLNSSSEYLVAQDCSTADIGTSDFTMLAWVRTPQVSGGTVLSKFEIVLVSGQQRPVGYHFGLDQGLPTFQARIPTTSNPFLYTGSFLPPVNDNQWHLVAMSVDRDSTTGLRFSVDGVQSPLFQNPTAWQGPINTNAGLFMGRIDPTLNAGGAHLTGNLDEIQIYKRALSLAEIQAIYNAGPDGVCKNSVPVQQSCGGGGSN